MSPDRSLTLLVHRPGRMMAIVATAALALGGAAVLGLRFGLGAGSGWWNLAVLVPMMVGFAAIMRTGTSRCEVTWNEHELTVRSVDAAQVLGRSREAVYRWREVAGAGRSGRQGERLRVRFTVAPRVLIFSGSARTVEELATVLTRARPPASESG